MANSTTPKFPNVHVRRSGKDGNVFLIMGVLAGREDVKSFMNEMLNAGSYGEALQTVTRWVDVMSAS